MQARDFRTDVLFIFTTTGKSTAPSHKPSPAADDDHAAKSSSFMTHHLLPIRHRRPIPTHSQSPQLNRSAVSHATPSRSWPRFPFWENPPSQFAGNFSKKRIMVSVLQKSTKRPGKAPITSRRRSVQDYATCSFSRGNAAPAGRQRKPWHVATRNLPEPTDILREWPAEPDRAADLQ